METKNELEEIKEKTEIPAGTVTETTIARIELGTNEELMPEAMIKASTYEVDLAGKCARITCGDGTIEYFSVPALLGKKSKLAKFKKMYGTMPKTGMSIKTIADANGFTHILMG